MVTRLWMEERRIRGSRKGNEETGGGSGAGPVPVVGALPAVPVTVSLYR